MRLRQRAQELGDQYAPDTAFPLGGYAITTGTYVGVVAALTLVVRASGRPVPERPAPADVLLLSVATHKLSRLLAKDAVTSPLRAPFTRYERPAGDAELIEQVRGHGTRHAVGELISCPFCLAVWVATVFSAGLVLAPRLTRLVTAALTAVAASDFLQIAYDAAKDAGD